MKRALLSILLAVVVFTVTATPPLYIVNGVETDSLDRINPNNVEHIETLPADEQTVARYGERANGGVILITLKYDREAEFSGGGSFNEWVAGRIKWPPHYPTARVVMRYTVGADGTLTVGEELECTDRQLRKRVVAAMKAAPAWTPAMRGEQAVASEHVLRVQLPEGKPMPQERYIIIR